MLGGVDPAPARIGRALGLGLQLRLVEFQAIDAAGALFGRQLGVVDETDALPLDFLFGGGGGQRPQCLQAPAIAAVEAGGRTGKARGGEIEEGQVVIAPAGAVGGGADRAIGRRGHPHGQEVRRRHLVGEQPVQEFVAFLGIDRRRCGQLAAHRRRRRAAREG